MQRRELLQAGANAIAWTAQTSTDGRNRSTTQLTNWSSHRGGKHRNGIVDIEPPGRPKGTRWEIGGETEPVSYGAAVLDRIAYVSLGNRLLAIEINDRNVLWSYDVGEATVPPAVDSDSVYLATEGGRIVAINRQNGNRRWQRITGAKLGAPTVADGDVYFGGFGEQARVFSMRGGTGEGQWAQSFEVNYPAYTLPVVTIGNESVYFAFDGKIKNIRLTNSEVIWEGSSARFGPAFYKNKLYLTRRMSRVDAVSGNTEWYSEESRGQRFPVVSNGRVIAVDEGANWIRSHNMNNGDFQWEFSFDERGTTYPSVAKGMVGTSQPV